MPAGRNFCTTANEPCRVPAKYSNAVRPRSRMACVERVAFVDVEERLVPGIVWEHVGGDGQAAGPSVEGEAEGQLQRTGVPRAPSPRTMRRQRAAVGAHGEPRGQQVGERRRLLRREVGIEQPLGRLDGQIVRDVEDVDDQRALDRVGAQPQVEVAERYGVRPAPAAPRKGRRRSRRHGAAELDGIASRSDQHLQHAGRCGGGERGDAVLQREPRVDHVRHLERAPGQQGERGRERAAARAHERHLVHHDARTGSARPRRGTCS